MTLNLPQMLHDLNHYHLSPFLVPGSPFDDPSTSISRFSRNVPHLPWHSTPSRCRSAGYTPSLAAPVPSPTFPRHSFLATFDDPLEIYCLPYSISSRAYRDGVLFFLLRLTLSAPPPLARTTSAFLFREASQFQTCQF